MSGEPSIPFTQMQESALAALAATIRDWCSKSWIFPDTLHNHPIAALSGAFPDLDGEFLRGEYCATLEAKLAAWEKAAGRAIRHWDAHRAADLCRIFPAAVPPNYRGRVPVVRKVDAEWHCVYPPAEPVP